MPIKKLLYMLLIGLILVGCGAAPTSTTPVYSPTQLTTLSTLTATTRPPTPTPLSTQTQTPTALRSQVSTATTNPVKISLGQPVWIGRGQIVDAAFLPDRSGVVVGWGSGVSLIVLESGFEAWYVPGPAPLIKSGVQRQGISAAAVFSDGSLMVIDIASGQSRRYVETAKPYGGQWGSLVWSPDGKTVAYQFVGDPVYLLDVASGQVSEAPGSNLGIMRIPRLLWSPDGKTIAVSGLGDHCPKLLDISSGIEQMSLGKTGACLTLDVGGWAVDGRSLSIITQNGDLELLSFPDGAVLKKIANPGPLAAHPDSGQPMIFDPGGKWMANLSGIREGYSSNFEPMTVWDAVTGDPVARIKHPTLPSAMFYRMAATFDGSSLLMLYSDGTLTRWNFLTEKIERPLFQLPVPAAQPYSLTWSRNGQRLAYTGSSGGVFVWDTESGQTIAQFLGELDSPGLNRDGSLLALVDRQKGEQQVINLATGAVLLRLSAASILGGTAFSPDGAFLAYSQGSQAALVNLITGKIETLQAFSQGGPDPGYQVAHLVWSPDSQALVVAAGNNDPNGRVVLWQKKETDAFIEVTQFDDPYAGYPTRASAEFSLSGSRVALQSVIANGEDTRPGVFVYDLRVPGFIQSLPDYLIGKWVNDGTLLLREADLASRMTHVDVISGKKGTGCSCNNNSEVYAPDGLYYLQSGNPVSSVAIYHWDTGNTDVVADHGSDLIGYSWSPDGGWIATVGGDGTVRVWPVSYE